MRVGPTAGISGLIDQPGRALAVPVIEDPTTFNPAAISLDRGDVSPGVWGFAWRGSWCGATATAVRFRFGSLQPVNRRGHKVGAIRDLGAITVPLSGPRQWSGLRAHLTSTTMDTFQQTNDGHTLSGLQVTLRNVTNRSIPLAPCPRYTVEVESRTVGAQRARKSVGGTMFDGQRASIPCRSS